jgi:hypothetical protein
VLQADVGSLAQFEQISALQRDGRIHAFAEADYRPDSTAHLWLTTEVRRIAERIADERDTLLRRAVRAAPRHVVDAPATTPTDAPMEEPEDVPPGPMEPAPRAADRPADHPSGADSIREAVRRSMASEPDADGEAVHHAEPLQDRLPF